MEPCKIPSTTQRLVSSTGAGRHGNIFSFQSREKMSLRCPLHNPSWREDSRPQFGFASSEELEATRFLFLRYRRPGLTQRATERFAGNLGNQRLQ